MKRFMGLVVPFVLLISLLVGCAQSPAENQTGTPESEQPAAAQGAGAEQEAPEAETAAWPRTITDAAGNEVVLEAKPERIAILHSMYLEYFFALETPPAASAGANVGTAMKALETFATLKPYLGTADIMDLGSARELNLEAILAADPDVIVTFFGHGGVSEIYDQLVQIAPVVQLDYTASWQEAIRDCAEIVGEEDLAEACIAETEAKMNETRALLSSSADETVIFVRSDGMGGIFALGYSRYPYYYDTNTGFGLAKPEAYPAEWGVVSLESLAEMDPDYIIFQDFLEDAQAVVDSQAGSAVWQNLKAVKNDHILYFDVSLNTTSPLAIQVAADSLAEAMGK